MSRWGQNFFGLRPKDKEYILEEIYQLISNCQGVSYSDVWNMPVVVRKWFIGRISSDKVEQLNNSRRR